MTEQQRHEEVKLIDALITNLQIRKNQINIDERRQDIKDKIKCLCNGLADLYEGRSAHQKPRYYLCAGGGCDAIVNDFEHKKLKTPKGGEYYYCEPCRKKLTYSGSLV